MNKTKQIIPQINNQLEQFKSSIDVMIQQNNEYFNSIKRYSNKTFDIETNEEITEETKNEIDTMIDQLEDIQQRNEIVLQQLDEFNLKIQEMKETMENTLKNEYLNNKEFYQNKLYQFSEIVMQYYDKEKEKRLNKLMEEKRKIIEEMQQISNPYNKYIDEKIQQSLKDFLDKEEIQQLEEWTNMKCREVVFDSDVDNWNVNSSIFDDRVMNRSNLMFVIEDTNKNKFGGYITSKIDKYDSDINDFNSFVFSLKSNNRINGMMKFEIQSNYSQYAFRLYDKSDSYLFGIGCGHDIRIYKENSKSSSTCYQDNNRYNYHGTSNAFLQGCSHGSSSVYFTPKRITVIQMK